MAQKLILPINKSIVTASIDVDVYRKEYGFGHYGTDFISNETSKLVYASGNGVVVDIGTDSVVGNVIVVLYYDAYNHKSGKSHDIIFRYFHLDSIVCKKGQKVNKDSRLGYYGSTGKYVYGAHLHLEADTDTKYPKYTPTLLSGSFLRGTSQGAIPFKNNRNTTVNVTEYLHCKKSPPDNQTWQTRDNPYIRKEDKSIPIID